MFYTPRVNGTYQVRDCSRPAWTQSRSWGNVRSWLMAACSRFLLRRSSGRWTNVGCWEFYRNRRVPGCEPCLGLLLPPSQNGRMVAYTVSLCGLLPSQVSGLVTDCGRAGSWPLGFGRCWIFWDRLKCWRTSSDLMRARGRRGCRMRCGLCYVFCVNGPNQRKMFSGICSVAEAPSRMGRRWLSGWIWFLHGYGPGLSPRLRGVWRSGVCWVFWRTRTDRNGLYAAGFGCAVGVEFLFL